MGCKGLRPYTKKQLIHILLDKSNTHNFIDTRLVEKLGCVVTLIRPSNMSLGIGLWKPPLSSGQGFSMDTG